MFVDRFIGCCRSLRPQQRIQKIRSSSFHFFTAFGRLFGLSLLPPAPSGSWLVRIFRTPCPLVFQWHLSLPPSSTLKRFIRITCIWLPAPQPVPFLCHIDLPFFYTDSAFLSTVFSHFTTFLSSFYSSCRLGFSETSSTLATLLALSFEFAAQANTLIHCFGSRSISLSVFHCLHPYCAPISLSRHIYTNTATFSQRFYNIQSAAQMTRPTGLEPWLRAHRVARGYAVRWPAAEKKHRLGSSSRCKATKTNSHLNSSAVRVELIATFVRSYFDATTGGDNEKAEIYGQ